MSVLVDGERSAETADQPRHPLGERVEHLAARIAARHALFVGGEVGNVRIPALGQFVLEHQRELGAELRIGLAIAREGRFPFLAQRAAAPGDRVVEMLGDAFGDVEILVSGQP